jgi:hypothetical protein
MEDRYRAFGTSLSRAIIDKNYAAAEALLAPWLSVAALREGVDGRIREMCEEWAVESPLYPAGCDLDGNGALKLEYLRDDDEHVLPAQLTDDNFRYWLSLQFLPAEGEAEFDAFFDLWVAIVEHEGTLRAGYLWFTDPD